MEVVHQSLEQDGLRALDDQFLRTPGVAVLSIRCWTSARSNPMISLSLTASIRAAAAADRGMPSGISGSALPLCSSSIRTRPEPRDGPGDLTLHQIEHETGDHRGVQTFAGAQAEMTGAG